MTRPHARQPASPHRQRGIAMFIALTMLLLITVIGLALAQTQTVEERMAANTQNHNVALQAGEAALRYAEAGILGGQYSAFAGNTNGLYYFDPLNPPATPVYMSIPWSASTNSGSWPAPGTSSGAGLVSSSGHVMIYNGPSLSTDNSIQPPEFIIEQLPSVGYSGGSIKAGQSGQATEVFRITAYGYGADSNSSAVVQSIMHQ